MPRGRRPLDAKTKARNRQESLKRYAAKWVALARAFVRIVVHPQLITLLRNQEKLRDAARERMQLLRTRNSEIIVSQGCTPKHVQRARASAATYREKALLEKDGTEALDERIQRPHMARTQKLHEGRPPPRKPRPSKWNQPMTENQRRCRTLRALGFEEDNGDDSDADIPAGMCGCDRTECQKMHPNETEKRRSWKSFELRYSADDIARM
ncbi:hypothetical protein C8R46DRAFT_1233199 [Mycena filopes]|nr:hypothetical protein C8R46DRAFT_1233199 [Mycena filopes]